MIKLIFGHDVERFPVLFDQMHRLRKKVFHDQLKWDVQVAGNWEIDHYDALSPLYVLVTDKNESEVVGCVRILQSTGLNMLNDTFPQLLPDGLRIESPLIWELSRFTLRAPTSTTDFAKLSGATTELGLALNELGKIAGISHYVAVYDAHMHRLLRHAGCAGDPISEPVVIGGVKTYAVTYEVGDHWGAIVNQHTQAHFEFDDKVVAEFRSMLAAA